MRFYSSSFTEWFIGPFPWTAYKSEIRETMFRIPIGLPSLIDITLRRGRASVPSQLS